MAKIYNVPKGITIPTFNFKNVNEWKQKETTFINELKDWCIKRIDAANIKDEYVGEIIQFPVADSYAQYMVAATKPLELIHLPLGDAWDFQYANRLTKKDVIEKINAGKKLAKLFGGK